LEKTKIEQSIGPPKMKGTITRNWRRFSRKTELRVTWDLTDTCALVKPPQDDANQRSLNAMQ
jgi:hypothetical protein